VALVGEAAHLLPPIGAQGLNLGLRDAAAIGELVVEARRNGGDVGAADLADRYDRSRRTDVTGRALAVDLLNRSLLSDFLPMQGARGLSLFLMEAHRPAAPCRDARRRRAGDRAAAPDARGRRSDAPPIRPRPGSRLGSHFASMNRAK